MGDTKDFRHRQPAAMTGTWPGVGPCHMEHGVRGQRGPACRVCVGLGRCGSGEGHRYIHVCIWCLQKYEAIAKAPRAGRPRPEVGPERKQIG